MTTLHLKDNTLPKVYQQIVNREWELLLDRLQKGLYRISIDIVIKRMYDVFERLPKDYQLWKEGAGVSRYASKK